MLSKKQLRKMLGIILLAAIILSLGVLQKNGNDRIIKYMTAKLTAASEKVKPEDVEKAPNIRARMNIYSGPSAEEMNDPQAINVTTFGAKGDGNTDDTDSIQNAINSLPDSGGKVVIPTGTYLVDAVKSIRLKKDVTLLMANDTILKAMPNGEERYAVLAIGDTSNVIVLGGNILGEREGHQGTTGEWGMGIRITGSKNVKIQGTVVQDCWGDGFYIGTGTASVICENVSLINVEASNNRRQGLSLIAGRNIEINGSRFVNTNGTAPAAGIDIEPNKSSEVLTNIKIIDIDTANNVGSGIMIGLGKLDGTDNPVDIQISNHQDNGSDRGLTISGNEIVPGAILIEAPEWQNSRRNGLAVQDHDHRSFPIKITKPKIINPNSSDSNSRVTGSAIAIYHFRGDPLERTADSGIGNVTVTNPLIIDDRSKMKTAFYIWDMPGIEIQELTITDPEIRGKSSNDSFGIRESKYIRYSQGAN